MNRILMVLLLAIFFSCGNTEQEASKTEVKVVDQAKLKGSLDKLEEELKANKTARVDKKKANALISQSIQYVDAFPKDEMSPEYLFRAGEVCVGIGEYDKALEYWERVQTDYKTHKKASVSLFLQGFTSENQMNDKEKAKSYYNNFLAKYPNNEYADQVKMLLKNIDISPEDLIKSFQKKEKQ